MKTKSLIVVLGMALLMTGAAQAATISANPFHVSLNPTETTSSTISWSGTSGTIQVYVSVNNGADQQIYSGTGSSTSYSGIQTPNWYVFKLKQGSTQLAWTAVTTQWKPDFSFGYNILPTHLGWFIDEIYTDPQVQKRLNQDLIHTISLQGGSIRFNFWSFGTRLDYSLHQWTFDPDLYEIVNNVVDWLAGPCYDNKVRVVIAFHNGIFTDGLYAGAGMTLDQVKQRTVEWMSIIINAIEANAKAKMVVYGYDYQNELYYDGAQTPNIIDYVRYVYDNTPVPMGKRVISLARKEYISDWASWLSPRRFDYVDLHFYPDAQGWSDQPSQLPGHVDTARAAYPNATVYMGEYGHKGGNSFPSNEGSSPTNEDTQTSKMIGLADAARNKSLMYHMAWAFTPPLTDGEPSYNMTYSADQPKDVIGSLSASANVNTLTNPDAESATSGRPTGWTGSSNISYTFTRQGPNGANAATNSYFGRMSIGSGSSTDWAAVDMSALTFTPISGVNYNVYVNGYVRSNMNIKLGIREYNGSTPVREQYWPWGLMALPANTWKNLQSLVDIWVPSLHPSTNKVVVCVVGYGNGSNPSLLDVDGMSACIRAADRAMFSAADFNHSGTVDIIDLQTLATQWLCDTNPANLNHLVHRYSFNNSNINDSVGTAHATLVNLDDPCTAGTQTFYQWGPGYLQLSNGWDQKADLSRGGAYVDLPDNLMKNLGSRQLTLELWGDESDKHWEAGHFVFGNKSRVVNGNSSFFGMASYIQDPPNDWCKVSWTQSNGNYYHETDVRPSLNSSYHFAFTLNDNQDTIKAYVNGVWKRTWTGGSWEGPGINGENGYDDVDNWLGRTYGGTLSMLNGRFFEMRIYDTVLSDAEITQSFTNGPNRLCEKIDGDMNGDCRVDMEDFAIFAQQWLQ